MPIDVDRDAVAAYLGSASCRPRTRRSWASASFSRASARRRGRRGARDDVLEIPASGARGAAAAARGLHRELVDRLREAVRIRLMSDVPLGAMLSGGLDSSLDRRPDGGGDERAGQDLQRRLRGDGAQRARGRALRRHGLRHRSPRARAFLADDTPSTSRSSSGRSTSRRRPLGTGILRSVELARRHVTVALSGQGADELFAGYERYRNAALVTRWRSLPGWSRGPTRAALRLGPRNARRAAEFFAADGPVELFNALNGRDRATVDGIRRTADSDVVTRMITERFGDVPDGDPVASTLYLDAQLGLPDDMLHYFDRTSMAHSLEVRVPFLDHPLVEWAAPSRPSSR